MDPNATLKEIMSLVNGLYDADPDSMSLVDARTLANEGCLLAEHIKNLDEWLTKGGFLPTRWTR